MRSALWEAQDALYAAISGATFPDREIQIALGRPATLERDAVWVSGEVDSWQADHRVSGLQAKDETFTLRVYVYSVRLGNYVDARNRVKALAQVVEDTIYGDHTLDGTVMLSTIERGGMAEAVMEDGRRRQVLLTLYVNCSAFISAP